MATRTRKKDPVCDEIVARRKVFGMNQKQLANLADIDVSTLSRLETGKSDFTLRHLQKIARALRTTAAELLGGADIEAKLTLREERLLADFRETDERGRLTIEAVARAEREEYGGQHGTI